MAWKEDSFWEEHPQPVSTVNPYLWQAPPRPRQGLRLKPKFRLPEDGGLFTCSVVALMFLYQVAPGLFEPWLLWVTFPAFFLVSCIVVNNVIPATLSRYYLFDAVDGAFVSRRPMHRFDVLRRVASDTVLIQHLGESDWRRAPVGIAWAELFAKAGLIACFCFLALGIIAALFYGVTLNWAINMGVILAPTAFVALMYRRVAPSRPRGDYQGGAAPPDDGDRIPYDRVTAATLHWDRLAQREYLRLEHNGGSLRYYNFTGDPLYLLRLLKQRMPEVELRVVHIPRGRF